MKDWIMELCPEIAEWQAEAIEEYHKSAVKLAREALVQELVAGSGEPSEASEFMSYSKVYSADQLAGAVLRERSRCAKDVNSTHALQRLLRIMGTFDLATGHADTFDDALDSLESELRDVLGHYRAALTEKQEPVAWMVYTMDGKSVCVTDSPSDFTDKHRALPLYTHPAPVNQALLEALKEIEWSNDSKWQSDRARAAIAAAEVRRD